MPNRASQVDLKGSGITFMDGTYSFAYSGAIGLGLGVFTVRDAVLTGADFMGGRYRGSVTPDADNPGKAIITFEMKVQAGAVLAQGTSAQDLSYVKSAAISVPDDFGDGVPFTVYVAPGNVTFMVKRVTDDWAPYADGFQFTMTPIANVA
jgi:hypothetical protein